MTDAEIDALRVAAPRHLHRITFVDTSEGKAVLKQQRPPRSLWRGRALNALARAFGLSMLQAVPAHGGATAQAIEAARLRALATAGVHVPPVLCVEPGFILLGLLEGPSLVELIEKRGAAGHRAWQSGLAAIADLHARGGYLSHGFARNFIATPDGPAMIDFEDDPLEVMSLDEAQARDWLAYLHSTVWLLDAAPDAVRAEVERHLVAERPEVRSLVALAVRRIAWLRHLPRSRRPLGREALGVRSLASLFPLHITHIA